MKCSCEIVTSKDGFIVTISGELNVTTLSGCIAQIEKIKQQQIATLNLDTLKTIDTAAALYLSKLQKRTAARIVGASSAVAKTLALTSHYADTYPIKAAECSFLERVGIWAYKRYSFFVELLAFIGLLFTKKLPRFFTLENFRYKEILYEIHQSAIRAVGIVALTSFLVGVVIAYQSAVQLKLYGANIFIVDMLGISILRELAAMITTIVIAGRSGSSYTAEIGAMKITQELDAMRTMGFDPYFYLVIPRIIALCVALPVLIFVADIAGIFGGMLIAHSQLDISFGLFLDRFSSVIALKHFVIGEFKGPFFAFLIAIISIHRGFMVKDDTQSIGKNTTKSVVESIFAVIVCDALFSVIFTNLGI